MVRADLVMCILFYITFVIFKKILERHGISIVMYIEVLERIFY